ncbi:hypothetical protein J6590_054660 [Homalodisca vitripennis]|nr:hypothetical protein J6590_054660 [Homalodisca vitripennis]
MILQSFTNSGSVTKTCEKSLWKQRFLYKEFFIIFAVLVQEAENLSLNLVLKGPLHFFWNVRIFRMSKVRVGGRPVLRFREEDSRLYLSQNWNPPVEPTLGTAKTDVSLKSGQPYECPEQHIPNRKCRDSGVHGQFDRSSLLREMTVGVGGVCSLTSEVLASLNKGVPPLAYFDWRGWFRAGFPFFRGDMALRCSALILPHGSL